MRPEKKSGLALVLLIAAQGGVSAQDAADADADAEITTAEIVARLERVENTLSNQGLLDLLQQVEALQAEVNRLRGDAEVQNHALEQLKKRQRDLYTDIDRRLQRFEAPATSVMGGADAAAEPPLQTLSPLDRADVAGGRQPAETPLTLELVDQAAATAEGAGGDAVSLAPAAEQAAESVVGEETEAETPGATPESTPEAGAAQAAAETPETADDATAAGAQPDQAHADYQYAFSLLKQSYYERSILAFREFLARYPDSEYADNAQFWLAEAYYVNKLFEQALAEYGALRENYPESEKQAQAKLKAGFCQHERGQIEPARQQLEELIQQYPGTTAARLAEERLKRIAMEATAAETAPTDAATTDAAPVDTSAAN